MRKRTRIACRRTRARAAETRRLPPGSAAEPCLNPPYRNRLLSAVSLADLSGLEQHLERVTLTIDRSVVEPLTPITHVYFIESGLLSVMAGSAPTARIEIGMIGHEGFAGTSVVLGAPETPFRTLSGNLAWRFG